MATFVPLVKSSEEPTTDLVAEITFRLALEVPPIKSMGPVVVTAVVVLVDVPGVLLVTFKVTWQLAPTAKLATFKRALTSPTADARPFVLVTVPQAAGVKVNVVFKSVMPVGKVSGSWTPVNVPGLTAGFVTVKVSTLVPPAAMVVGLKFFVTVGGV